MNETSPIPPPDADKNKSLEAIRNGEPRKRLQALTAFQIKLLEEIPRPLKAGEIAEVIKKVNELAGAFVEVSDFVNTEIEMRPTEDFSVGWTKKVEDCTEIFVELNRLVYLELSEANLREIERNLDELKKRISRPIYPPEKKEEKQEGNKEENKGNKKEEIPASETKAENPKENPKAEVQALRDKIGSKRKVFMREGKDWKIKREKKGEEVARLLDKKIAEIEALLAKNPKQLLERKIEFFADSFSDEDMAHEVYDALTRTVEKLRKIKSSNHLKPAPEPRPERQPAETGGLGLKESELLENVRTLPGLRKALRELGGISREDPATGASITFKPDSLFNLIERSVADLKRETDPEVRQKKADELIKIAGPSDPYFKEAIRRILVREGLLSEQAPASEEEKAAKIAKIEAHFANVYSKGELMEALRSLADSFTKGKDIPLVIQIGKLASSIALKFQEWGLKEFRDLPVEEKRKAVGEYLSTVIAGLRPVLARVIEQEIFTTPKTEAEEITRVEDTVVFPPKIEGEKPKPAEEPPKPKRPFKGAIDVPKVPTQEEMMRFDPFLEFLERFPVVAEIVSENPQKIAEWYEVFRQKEILLGKLIAFYSKEWKELLGVDMTKEDFAVLSEELEKVAVQQQEIPYFNNLFGEFEKNRAIIAEKEPLLLAKLKEKKLEDRERELAELKGKKDDLEKAKKGILGYRKGPLIYGFLAFESLLRKYDEKSIALLEKSINDPDINDKLKELARNQIKALKGKLEASSKNRSILEARKKLPPKTKPDQIDEEIKKLDGEITAIESGMTETKDLTTAVDESNKGIGGIRLSLLSLTPYLCGVYKIAAEKHKAVFKSLVTGKVDKIDQAVQAEKILEGRRELASLGIEELVENSLDEGSDLESAYEAAVKSEFDAALKLSASKGGAARSFEEAFGKLNKKMPRRASKVKGILESLISSLPVASSKEAIAARWALGNLNKEQK